MHIEALYHRHKQNWAFAIDEHNIRVRLRTKRDDVEQAIVCFGDKYNWYGTEQQADMHKVVPDALYDYWETTLQPPYGRLCYRFLLKAGDEQIYYGERWHKDVPPEDSYGNFEYPYLSPADIFQPPQWVKDAIFYQIFPDRFANGDTSNDPPNIAEWGSKPSKTNYFGGDLQGILSRLDHLVELGVNAIYFTPLFQADSHHKYDTMDYFNVDTQFGTNEDLKRLVDACHERNIKVLLDIVFNHSGGKFPPYLDVLDKGSDSPYAEWFLPVQRTLPNGEAGSGFETFGFEAYLPKLNTANPEVSEYLLSVAEYWLHKADVDGFRLDVANEVDHRFWRRFRDLVKATKPDAYILGEIYHDAMAWLQGDQLDAVMNYPIRYYAVQFFAKRAMDGKTFADHIGEQLAMYPLQAVEASFQILGSHDTARLLTLCHGSYAQSQLAVVFQFTYYGAPCIYYGDEFGMEGEDDPDNRACMVWEEEDQNREMYAFYRMVVALRKAYPALRTGKLRFVYASAGEYAIAYERWDEQDKLIVALNVAAEPVTLSFAAEDRAWTDVHTGVVLPADTGMLSISLPGLGYQILHAQSS